MPEGWSGSGPRARNCQSALGRLRASTRPALRPVREVLAALAPGRVLPFAPGNSRKRGPELSQGVKALASAAVERRKASAPRLWRASAPRAHSSGDAWMCGADIGWMRLSALRSPLYEPGASLKEFSLWWCANLGRISAARTDFYFHLSPVGRGRATQVACLRLAQFLCRTRASPCSVARVRGGRRCRFARLVPPHPPRTFGARLPLPTWGEGNMPPGAQD